VTASASQADVAHPSDGPSDALIGLRPGDSRWCRLGYRDRRNPAAFILAAPPRRGYHSAVDPRPIPIPNSYWLPGERILAGEYPGGMDPASTTARLRLFLDAGINSFVDLTAAGELVSYEPYLNHIAGRCGLDVRYHRAPIEDFNVPAPEDMNRTLDYIEAEQAAGRTVYVHCWGGVGRTGTVVGCWFVRKGLDGKAALAELARLWRTVEKCDWCPESPESDEQRDFVLGWNRSI
jgi:protein-tyrosine phosphatase